MQTNEDCWPYLTPLREGWRWISGTRATVRRAIGIENALTAADPVEAVLRVLGTTAEMSRALDTETVLLVTEAHYRGATWAAMARHLGGSRQRVHQRYQRYVHSPLTKQILTNDLRAANANSRRVIRPVR
ncbi:hypothetical protein [Micromonospora sp.]|jgi:hypothetical protein|uniref:hypothetical protein n=1 Tax=unclassified Micromonospora TaxID=2617518 RepID=UPI003B3B7FF7